MSKEEKSLIIEVTPEEKDAEMVQTMLISILAEDSLVHENVKIEFNKVVSDKLYKGLCYGQISSMDRDKMLKMESDGYELQYILCIIELKMDPCLIRYGSRGRLDEYYIDTNQRYIFKIKPVYARYKADSDKADRENVRPIKVVKVAAPF